MPAATSCRSTGVARCAVSGSATTTGNQADNHGVRDGMAIIYLLLFAAPQVLLYLYLRERLPLAARRWLTLVFGVFNIPWGIVAVRMFSGSLWGVSRVPYIAPWIAWQFLGWIFCGLVTLYLLGKGAVWIVRRASYVVRKQPGEAFDARRTTDDARLSRRQFLARATYAYGVAGVGLSAYGIWKDRKSTRLNSSHVEISYAVFCLKKKKRGRKSTRLKLRQVDYS